MLLSNLYFFFELYLCPVCITLTNVLVYGQFFKFHNYVVYDGLSWVGQVDTNDFLVRHWVRT